MEKEAMDFLDITNKKLAKIEKKIQEMKLNIVIMSFYSDLTNRGYLTCISGSRNDGGRFVVREGGEI